MSKVYVVDCPNYEERTIEKSFSKLIEENNLLSFVKPKMKIVIKANLVAAMKPETAATTHFMLLKYLCKRLVDMGADVIVGDSAGGLFNESFMKPIYNRSRVIEIEETGAKMNYNFATSKVKVSNGKVVNTLDCCEYLLKADAIINFAKLKSHGMMSLSCATKNMFGSVPGTNKLEYHYKYSDHNKFANMLIDIQEFYKPVLHIVDGVLAMEGNGPTQGSPVDIGLLLASNNPYELDEVCCKIIDLDSNKVPYLLEAKNRGLSSEYQLDFDLKNYIKHDFNRIEHGQSIQSFLPDSFSFINKIIQKLIESKPKPNKKECVGCEKCKELCPAKAISMDNKKPVIDRQKCIRCFCCQEFCPVGAMKVKQTTISKIAKKL